jgi:phosphoglycolate phosphatase
MLQDLKNTHKKNILFDLDGTIIDSAAAILSSFDKVFLKHQLFPIKKLDKHLIGPPLKETFISLLDKPSDNLINTMVEDFKFFYDSYDYKLSKLFPDILNCLEVLKNKDKVLILVTNKRNIPTKKIMKHLGLEFFFKKSYSLDSFDPNMKSKSELIKQVLSKELLNIDETIYIGDRIEDGIASKNNNIQFIMVPWGYK